MSYQQRNSFAHMVSIGQDASFTSLMGWQGTLVLTLLTPKSFWAVTRKAVFIRRFFQCSFSTYYQASVQCREGVVLSLSLLQTSSLAVRLSLLEVCVNHSKSGSPAVCWEQLTKVTEFPQADTVLPLVLMLLLLFHVLADRADAVEIHIVLSWAKFSQVTRTICVCVCTHYASAHVLLCVQITGVHVTQSGQKTFQIPFSCLHLQGMWCRENTQIHQQEKTGVWFSCACWKLSTPSACCKSLSNISVITRQAVNSRIQFSCHQSWRYHALHMIVTCLDERMSQAL